MKGFGLEKRTVDDYIAGQTARVAKQTADVAAVVGGEENLQPVLNWAGENLSAEDINFYNEATKQGTTAAKMALETVYNRFITANGAAPNLLNGDTTNSSGKDVFKSSFEMTQAQQDKRYWSDPDFQREVEDKIKRSIKAGTV